MSDEPGNDGDHPMRQFRPQVYRPQPLPNTVDSRLSARGLTALRLNRGNVFLKKKFYFP
jgi:hypothetical protein